MVEKTTKERRDKGVEDDLGTTVIALVLWPEKTLLLRARIEEEPSRG